MEKTTIRFRVSGQNLTMVGNHHRFASNSVGLVRIEIDPEDEWIQFDSVDAVFQNDQDKTTMTMFYEGASYTCTVPADMLSRMAKVYVNLSGKNIVDGELVERLTTYPVLAFIIDETSNVSNYRDSVVPANQYEQFIEAVGRQASKLADVEVTAHQSEEPEVIKTYTPNHPLSLDFGLVKGDKGDKGDQGIQGIQGETGDAAGFGTVSATVDANHGTPAVTVTASGDDTAKNFAFAFSNLQPAPYDDSVIQARMDTFTNLAAGSTTGDAELADGRVGADGVTYTNIGGAIRGQVTDLKSDLSHDFKYVVGKENLLESTTWTAGAYISESGVITPYANAKYTDLIPVNTDELIYYYRATTTSQTTRVHGYDSNGTWVAQIKAIYTPSTVTDKSESIKVSGYAYIRISESTSITPLVLIENTSVFGEIEKIEKIKPFSKNLVGMIPNKKYPAFLASGSTVTISTSDGSVFDPDSTLRIRFLRQDGVEIDYFGLKNGESSRTVYTYSGDAYYLTFNEIPSVPLMVNYGSTPLSYEPCVLDLWFISEAVTDYINRKNDPNTSVLALNDGVSLKIKQAKHCMSSEVSPLLLAHISDLHLDGTRLKRFVDFVDSVSDIDDSICTGDMVDSYANGMSYWTAAGASNIMTVIGNHDGLVDDSGGWYDGQCSMSDAYNRFMSPYISNWGVTHTGSNTYYYKDYPSKKIRLIVIDSMRSGTDATTQNTWLANVLADAKTNGYHVVIATHCVPQTTDGIDYIDCTFTSKKFTYQDLYDGCITFDSYQQTVQNFITNGGHFICWICGHTHVDFVYTTQEYPNQLWIVVTCGKQNVNNDQDRTIGTRDEDAFNLLSFDINNGIVKVIRVGADRDCYIRHIGTVSINYTTQEVVFND